MAPARTRGHEDRRDLTGWDEEFERSILRAAGDAGILGVSVPVEYGGAGHSPSWQAMVAFEAVYHDAPLIDTAAALVAPTVVAFGDDAQRAELVPATCLGTVTVCTAYTEAGAGSDLSNITTLARLDADRDRFVLTGEKVLVTGAHKADWCCTIARTDPASSGRHGLSMFLFPMATPGIEITRHATANRWTLSTLRFADVAVDRGAVLGQLDQGWKQLTGALLGERSGSVWMGWATRNLEALLADCTGTRDAVLRGELAGLVTHWFGVLRQMERVLDLQDAGTPSIVEGAMSKVYATELLQRIARGGRTRTRRRRTHRTGLVRWPVAGVVQLRAGRAAPPDAQRGRQRDPANDDRQRGPGASARAPQLKGDAWDTESWVGRRVVWGGWQSGRSSAAPTSTSSAYGCTARRRPAATRASSSGIGPIGVAATSDADALIALAPDCVCYTASGESRPDACVADISRMLAAGINVVTTSIPGLVHPAGYNPKHVDRLEAACREGGASLYASGIEPGFAGDQLVLTLATLSNKIRSVRTQEIFTLHRLSRSRSRCSRCSASGSRPSTAASCRSRASRSRRGDRPCAWSPTTSACSSTRSARPTRSASPTGGSRWPRA